MTRTDPTRSPPTRGGGDDFSYLDALRAEYETVRAQLDANFSRLDALLLELDHLAERSVALGVFPDGTIGRP